MLREWVRKQREVCERYGVVPVGIEPEDKLGIARNVGTGLLPINGVRTTPEHGTCGWYIWAGEWSDDPEFFEPLHVAHVEERCQPVLPFLLLPPGWRFLIGADGYTDAWFDPDVELSSTR